MRSLIESLELSRRNLLEQSKALEKAYADLQATQAELIQAESEARMTGLLGALLRDTDIELLAVSLPSLAGEPIETVTNALFERWQVGHRTNANRGLLLVVAVQEQLVRFEVSYELEGIFTDAFVSYIEHEQMVPYFAHKKIGEGIEATVELIARRAFERILGKDYDPSSSGPDAIGGYRSGGAGAQTAVTFGGAAAPARAGADAQAAFGAQPTPTKAWECFLDVNRRRIKDPELGIYDDAAKTLMRGVSTNAGQDHLAQLYTGKSFTVRQEGARAAIVFLEDPNNLLAPWFLHKTASGWQLDGSMYPEVIGYNHLNQWHFKRPDHPYAFAFTDFYLDQHGFAFYRPGRAVTKER
jgi:uncharacterized protein